MIRNFIIILGLAWIWIDPASAQVRHGLREHGGYSVENVAIETVPGFFLTGNLYRPVGRKDLTPVVLCSRPKIRDAEQLLCAHLARMGATVFLYDASPHEWYDLRAREFVSGLERVDRKRIATVEDPAGEPSEREKVYESLARTLPIRRNAFQAFGERDPKALEILPEDLGKIEIETLERLRDFGERKIPEKFPTTAEVAAHLKKLRQLRASPALRLTDAPRAKYTFKAAGEEDERIIFTPPGFDEPGEAKVAGGAEIGTVEITVRDSETGEPTFCRINVVGPDGHYYEPADHDLKRHSLTGVWPKSGWGNRPTKAPIRYLGRYFYSDGKAAAVAVPAGAVRVEVWKGFEYTPATVTTHVGAGQKRKVELTLRRNADMAGEGYWSGDPHIHIQRLDEAGERRIFDLLEAEDIRYGSILAYNEPAGRYAGFMKRMEAPQLRGLGKQSIRRRGDTWILSGEEYRSSTFGHLNLFLLDELVLPGREHNANDWPPYGHVVEKAREAGGIAFYAHGGYAKEIYADVAQGKIDGVELLQFGVYRGIGLDDWYHMLNAGFRVPANGACDYPACRKLGDCKTYVYSAEKPDAEAWFRGMGEGRSFFTSGPMLLLEVDGIRPGGRIDRQTDRADGTLRVTAKIRVRSEVAPVTHVQLIANGRILHELTVPPSAGQGSWIEIEHDVELEQSAWIAARAFSLSATGTPDAEAHTNPVHVYLDDRAPFEAASVDVLIAAVDRQIDFHQQREFAKRGQVIAYFQRSRDILVKLREAGGAPSTGHPSDLVAADPSLNIDPGRREHTEEELQAFLKPVPPKPIDEVLRSFETVGGFEMQLVAKEPLVYDPIAAAFDESGNLYVCEMRDYPYKPQPGNPPIGTLRLLEDTDADGVFDESHVFAEELLWSGGVAPWKGGVFVAAPPDILYLKDTDGDKRADVREVVFTGFGTKNQQAMVNNLVWGLDHKIYGATAGNGGQIRPAGRPDAPAIEIEIGGRDFRFDPETREFETLTGTVQFGNTFDDWGNRFVCSQAQPLQHIVLPQRYLERNPHLPVPKGIHNLAPAPVPSFRSSPLERWRQIRSSRRIAHGQRKATDTGASHHVVDSAAGVTIYRGGAWPAEYHGNAFVGDAQNNFIHRRVLTPDGATFKSRRADPGTEFVRSSDNWFRPVNFVNAPDGTLYALDMSREIIETVHVPLDVLKYIDLRNGRKHGRIYRIAPPGFQYPGPPRLGEATTAELVGHLESPHGWWRDTAHRLIFERQDSAAVPVLRQLLAESPLPQARLHALWSLQGLGALSAGDLLRGLKDGDARVREHAIRLGEPRLDTNPELLKTMLTAAAGDTDPRIQFQLAFSLGESRDPRAATALAGIAKKFAGDSWIRTATLSSANGIADRVFVELLNDRDFRTSSNGRELLRQLLSVVGSRDKPPEIDRVLAALAETEDESLQIRLAGSLGNAFSKADSQSEFRDRLVESANRSARDSKTDPSLREAAVRLLGSGEFEGSREILAALLDSAQSEPVQLAAVDVLSASQAPVIASILLEGWSGYPPSVRARVTEALLETEDRTVAFLRAAEAGDATAASIDLARRPDLLKHENSTIRKLATSLFGGKVGSNRAEVVADYRAALELKGDPGRGRAVFQRACMACHRIGDLGVALGPDIASNASQDADALLVHVFDPNHFVDPAYEVYLCVDMEGRTRSGIITGQTATSITLNQTDTILRSRIRELTGTGKSLMPEGLEAVVSKPDLADLFAWLGSQVKEPLDIGTLPGMVEPENP